MNKTKQRNSLLSLIMGLEMHSCIHVLLKGKLSEQTPNWEVYVYDKNNKIKKLRYD